MAHRLSPLRALRRRRLRQPGAQRLGPVDRRGRHSVSGAAGAVAAPGRTGSARFRLGDRDSRYAGARPGGLSVPAASGVGSMVFRAPGSAGRAGEDRQPSAARISRLMFSTRLNWDLRPNRLAQALEQKRRCGVPILDLTESNPTHAGLDYPAAEILRALADPRSLRYDPAPAGMAETRAAISAWYAGRGQD